MKCLHPTSIFLFVVCLGVAVTPAHAEYAPFTDPETRNSPNVAIPGAVQVDGRMGSASYAFPFPVPPGTGGLTPSITLSFSSLMKHSEYGYGWNITYFGRIERSTRFGNPCYGEGSSCPNPRYDGVDDDEDVFELDGELMVPDNGVSGQYHKLRKDFSKITRSGNTWTVITPDGMRYTYGSSSGGRLTHSDPRPGATDTIFRWMLERIEDPRGNQIRISYTDFGEGTNLYPTEIRYSWNTKPGVADSAKRLVQFVWELRGENAEVEDRPMSFRAGFKTQFTRRLLYVASGLVPDSTSKLIEDTPGPSLGDPLPGALMLAKYELVYAAKPVPFDPNNAHTDPYSKLIAIQRYGSDNTAFQTRTEFEYSDPTPGYSATGITVNHDLGTAMINYDGVLSKWNNSSTTPIVTETTSGRLMDVNGDGIADRVLFTAYQSGQPKWEVALGSVNASGVPSYAAPVVWSWSAPSNEGCGQSIYYCSFKETCVTQGHGTLSVDLNSDTGYWRISEGYDVGAASTPSTVTVADFTDMNGDGLPDRVISRSNGPWTVYLNNGTGFDAPITNWTAPNVGTSGSYKRHVAYIEASGADNYQLMSQLMDLNGDGRPDHISRKNGTEVYVSYNTGSGFSANEVRELKDWGLVSHEGGSADQVTQLSTLKQFYDVNGDGLPDRAFGPGPSMPFPITSSTSRVRTYFNTGAQVKDVIQDDEDDYYLMFPPRGVQKAFKSDDPPPFFEATVIKTRGLVESYFDFNGDGVLDLLRSLACEPGDPGTYCAPDPPGSYDAGDLWVYYGLGDGRYLRHPVWWSFERMWWYYYGFREDMLAQPDLYNDEAGTPGWTEGDPLMTLNLPILNDSNISFNDYYNMDPERLSNGSGALSATTNSIRELSDVNGDGFPDIVVVNDLRGTPGNEHDSAYSGYDRSWDVHLHTGPATLLINVTNEYGGETAINYNPSVQYIDVAVTDLDGNSKAHSPPNTILSLGKATWVVKDQTVSDGRAGTPTTTTEFSYAKPRYDTVERELLGMRMNDAIVEDQRITRTIYRQQIDFPSIPELSETGVDNGSSWLWKSRTELTPTIVSTAEGGWFISEMETHAWRSENSSKSSAVKTAQKTTNNATYGYLESTEDAGPDGSLAATGDNIYSYTYYPSSPNTTDWLIWYPRETEVYSGGQLLSHTKLYYDDQDHNIAPTEGLVTRQEQVNVNPDGLPNTNSRQEYDEYGNPVKGWNPTAYAAAEAAGPSYPSTSTAGHETTQVTYDGTYYAFVTQVEDAQGDIAEYEIEPRTGRVEKVLDANGHLSCRTFDGFDRLIGNWETSSTSPVTITDSCDQQLAEYIYNNVPDPGNQYVETRTFDAPGQIASKSYNYFDGLGRSYKTTTTRRASEPNKHYVTLQSWNELGQLECESLSFSTLNPDVPQQCFTDSSVFLTHTYDPLGRKEQTDHSALGQLDSFSRFVDVGNVSGKFATSFGTPNRSTITYTDNRGQVTRVWEIGGNSTYFAYDPLGRIEEVNGPDVSTPNGPATTHPNHMFLTYDYLGRRTGLYKPNDVLDLNSGRRWEFDYDLNGNMTFLDSALAGKDVKYHYDVLGRMTWEDLEPFDVDNGEDKSFTYDLCTRGIGRLCTEQNSDVEIKYNYFLSGEAMTKEVIVQNAFAGHANGTSYLFRYNYDLLDRVIDKKFPDGEFFDFTYDGTVLDEVSSRQQGVWVDDLQYHDNGRLTSMHYAKGDFTSHFEFDPIDYRLDRIWTQGPTATVQDLNYTYDTAGNVTQIDDALNLVDQTFTYDILHRIKSAASTGTYNYGALNYTIDAAGNLKQKGTATLEYGGAPEAGAHAMTLRTDGGSFDYHYDWEGNLASRDVVGGTQAFTWDSQNRLEHIQLEMGGYLLFRYDNSGRRVHKIQCPTLTGCDAGWSGQTQATVDRLYVDEDYEIDLIGARYYKHVFVGGQRAVMSEYEGRGRGKAAP